MSDHTQVYSLLRMATNSKDNVQLMNKLQDLGLVSDNCVTIDDVADSDLMQALNTLAK